MPYHPDALSPAAIADLLVELLDAHVERCDNADPPKCHVVSTADRADGQIYAVRRLPQSVRLVVRDGATYTISITKHTT